MLINVLDVNLQKVAFLSNDVPGLPNYYDDEFHEYRDQGAATFKFTVKKVINNKLQSYARFLNGQSYFSFQIDGNDYLMTPASEQAIHETSEEISFFCVSLDRELMSEQANPLVNTSSHNIQWYFDQMGLISNTQITIGINEVSNLTRTINYDGQETKLARLISVIGNFDAEFEFITKLNNDGSLDSVTLNIYKENDGLDIQGVGKKRDDVRLIFGENIQAVERDVSTEGFLNATTVTGADNLSWKSASFSYTNDDGVEEFYKRAGDNTAYAPLSAKIYPAQLSKDKDDIWTRIDFTTEYKNVNDMWAYAVRQFKQYAYHQVSYTVTPSSKLVNAEIGDGPPLAKGDTVVIQDNNYIDIDGNVGLLLSARVSEKIVSETHPENNKLIFSNYKKLKNEVSTDIQAIVNQLVEAATPFRAELSTTNGTQFKNGTGSTTLSAHIFKGSATTETTADSYEWSKDGTVVANVQEITVDASGVANKAVYSFKATVAGKVVASQSVTITNVNDGKGGADGKTSYTHTAWANSADGTDGFTTVYPNLNFLNFKSGLKIGQFLAWADGLTIGPNPARAVFDYVSVIPGTTYTINSNWDKTERIAIYAYDSNDRKNATFIYDGSSAKWVSPSTIGRVITQKTTLSIPDGMNFIRVVFFAKDTSATLTLQDMLDAKTKVEQGSTATPWMPSSSEATTADWPSYIGQYSDFTQADSTNPSDYIWSLIRGNDGKDGKDGKDGTNGTDGNPGKIVSDTEPTTRFKGLTWKYSGIVDMTLGDGTKILAGTEYYWNGTVWALYEINAHNINGDNLSVTNGTFKDGKIESIWGGNGVNGTTTIEGSHLQIFSSNSTTNTENTIALDNLQGYAQVYTEHNTGRTRTAQASFQGFFISDSTGPYVSVTPTGIVSSVDVPWTTIGSYAAYRRDGGVVTIRVVRARTSVTGHILIGTIPQKDCPTANVMGNAVAWSVNLANDKHIQINGLNQQNSGDVTILSAAANQEYTFQFTYQI